MKIAELKENLSGLEGTYIVSDIHNDIAKNGSPYVRGKLSDITGSVNFTFLDGDYGLNPHMNGTIVHVESFATQIFNGKLQAYGRKSERPALAVEEKRDAEGYPFQAPSSLISASGRSSRKKSLSSCTLLHRARIFASFFT